MSFYPNHLLREVFTQHFVLAIFYDNLFFSYLLYVEMFAALLLYSIFYNMIPKKKEYDFIIIHGAGLLERRLVTPLLQKRIDKAIETFHASKNPEIQFIASGGQGADEEISEAQVIADYFVSKGIDEKKIIQENQSRMTYENLLFLK